MHHADRSLRAHLQATVSLGYPREEEAVRRQHVQCGTHPVPKLPVGDIGHLDILQHDGQEERQCPHGQHVQARHRQDIQDRLPPDHAPEDTEDTDHHLL